MKPRSLIAALLLPAFLPQRGDAEPTPAPSPEAHNQAGVVPSEARGAATAAAGVFTKEGFRIRDGEWSPTLAKGVPVFLKVTLFAGEEYGFAAATTATGGKLGLALFDSSGREAKSESRDAGGASRIAVRIAPGKSGAYFVKLELLESPASAPSDASLVYAYK